LFLDYGQHIFQIERAFKVERPHWVAMVIFERCDDDWGNTSCSSLNSI
jgi:hypothetical protein